MGEHFEDTDERDRWHDRVVAVQPEIVKGFPRGTVRFPCWSVLLASENDRVRAIGDRVVYDTVARQDVTGVIEDARISIWMWAETMDELEVHHRLVKGLMRGRTTWFIETIGYDLLVFAGAADEMPDPERSPELIHVRSQEWLFSGVEATYTDLGSPVSTANEIHTYLDDVTVDGVQGGVTPQ